MEQMGQYIWEKIEEISVFMLCGQVLLQLSASKKYEKYLQLLLEIMLLTSVFLFLMSIFNGEITKQFYDNLKEYENQVSENIEDVYREVENAYNDTPVFGQSE